MNPSARIPVPTATPTSYGFGRPKFMRIGAPLALIVAQFVVAACGAKSETGEANGDGQPDAAIGSGVDASADEGASTGMKADDTADDTTGANVDDESMEGTIDGSDDVGSDDTFGDDFISDDSSGEASSSDAGVSDGTATGSTGDGGIVAGEPALPKGVTIIVDTSADGGGEVQILCSGEPCACSDGEDDDNDGLADGADSECTGPFDNDESTFSTGIPGDNRDPKWQDCFFDGNSGAGDDDCRYHSDCLTGDLPKDDPSCQVTQLCKDTCQPLTPPGCDCFGCCEIQSGDSMLHILISDSCSLERIDDEAACPRCEPTDICNNECGECEVCVGKTLADLPESCFPPPDEEPPTGSGGAGNDDGDPPDGRGGDGSGGTGNTPPDDSPPDDSPPADGGDPTPPPTTTTPPNTCDGDAPSCVTSDDCPGTWYCGLGCCHAGFVVR